MSQHENGRFRLATPAETQAALEQYFNRPNDPSTPGCPPLTPLDTQRQHKISEHQSLVTAGHILQVYMLPHNGREKPVISYFKPRPTRSAQT